VNLALCEDIKEINRGNIPRKQFTQRSHNNWNCATSNGISTNSPDKREKLF